MTTTAPNHRSAVVRAAPVTHHRAATIDGVNIFYREAGPADAPVVLLLHGFPTPSHGHGNGERATREEIAEALGTAAAVNAGAALVYSARALDAFETQSAGNAPAAVPAAAEVRS